MTSLAFFLALIIFGMFLRKTKQFPRNTAIVLNQFVIYVSLPALVLLKVPVMVISDQLLVAIIVPWLVLVFSAGLVVVASKFFDWERQTIGALLLIVPLGNTSFIGVPMVKMYFSGQGIVTALIYDQLGSFMALAIYGTYILARYSSQKQAYNHLSVLYKIVTFPPFIALILAFILGRFALPQYYFEAIEPVALTLVPVVLVAVGFQLSLKIRASDLSPFFVGLSIKMLIAPALVLLFFIGLNLNGLVYQVVVFEAAMPPMISAGALAIMAQLSPKLTSAMLAYGIVLSFVTLPLVFYFLKYI